MPGIRGLLDLCQWYIDATGLKLSEKRTALERPRPAADHEDWIEVACETREREYLGLASMGPSGTGWAHVDMRPGNLTDYDSLMGRSDEVRHGEGC